MSYRAGRRAHTVPGRRRAGEGWCQRGHGSVCEDRGPPSDEGLRGGLIARRGKEADELDSLVAPPATSIDSEDGKAESVSRQEFRVGALLAPLSDTEGRSGRVIDGELRAAPQWEAGSDDFEAAVNIRSTATLTSTSRTLERTKAPASRGTVAAARSSGTPRLLQERQAAETA